MILGLQNLAFIGVIPSTVQTTAPTISNNYYVTKTAYWRVTNKDASTATIMSEADDSTPDINRGDLAYNAYVSLSYTYSVAPMETTFYATAEASGKTISTITSLYMEWI